VTAPTAPVITPSDILTPDQLAANLKVSRAWVLDQLRARNRRARPLPYFRVGRFPRFSWAAVTAWLTANQQAAPAARHRR
jgi:hypothetical protein